MVTKEDIANKRHELAEFAKIVCGLKDTLEENERIYQSIDYRATEERFERGEIDASEWEQMKSQYDALRVSVSRKAELIKHVEQHEQLIKDELLNLEQQYDKEHPYIKALSIFFALLYIFGSVFLLDFLFKLVFGN